MVVALVQQVLCHFQEIAKDLRRYEHTNRGEVSADNILAKAAKDTHASGALIKARVLDVRSPLPLSCCALEFCQVGVLGWKQRPEECECLRPPFGKGPSHESVPRGH